MPKKSVLLAAVCVCLVLSVATYALLSSQVPNSNNSAINGTDGSKGDNNQPQSTFTPNNTVTPAHNGGSSNNPPSNPTSSGGGGGGGALSVTSTPNPAVSSTPIPTTPVAHAKDHEEESDYIWNSADVMNVQLSDNAITTSSPNATVAGSKITITSAGTFRFTGSLSDGQILVNTTDKATIRLILSNVDVGCSSSAAIYVNNSKKVVIVLEENTVNTIRDARSLTTVDPNAAIFSASDITIYGSGQLTIQGNNNDGVTSKDGLIIKSGTINVNSLDDGIRGRDYLIVKDGYLTVSAGGDGLISDNTDSNKGFVTVENGYVAVTSGGDSIDAQADVTIANGQVSVTSGGGSTNTKSSSISMKGIKGLVGVTVNGGTITTNCADDAIHSNGTITLTAGTFSILTADDAIHADANILINSTSSDYPIIDIPKCYEGIESAVITINSGTIHITASDDGINGAGGNDGSGLPGPWPINLANSKYFFYVNGGYIVVTSVGDGVDINGGIVMTGGYIVVNGPTASDNGAIDYDTSFNMTGGFIVGVGSSGMSMAPSTTSTQYSALINFGTTFSPRTYSPSNLIHIQSTSGTEVITFQPIKVFQSISICSPNLIKGTTYNIYIGGSSTGTLKDGVYQDGTYSGGTKLSTSFVISTIVTRVTAS
jgi:hypothetical protein